MAVKGERSARVLVTLDPASMEAVQAHAEVEGLAVVEWVRACVRRELARLAAEKTKKGRK